MKLLDFIRNLFTKKQEQALPAPASRSATPLDRQIEALYAILVDVMGTEKLVIQAGKMKALDLMRSADPCERVLALQRILGEDPLINPAPQPEQVPAIMDALSERVADSATLYNSNLIFSPAGELAAHHRKLKPTGAERVVWGDAQSHYFPVADTPWGPMGSLICWESYMPLARVALYQKGVTLYLSPNTNDNPEWQDTVRHIAIEGRCYFINCDMFFTRDQYPKDLRAQEEIARLPEIVCRGGSNVIDPYGHLVTETLWDREGILYADLDLQQVPASRMEFDPCGHYARPDVLELTVNEGG